MSALKSYRVAHEYVQTTRLHLREYSLYFALSARPNGFPDGNIG